MLDQTTGPGYASPEEAVKAPKEKIVYTVCIYAGTGIEKPDYLATIDADEDSPSYGQVIHRLPMPNIGDELHHSGWNACSSCHCDSSKERKYLILPGVRTSNFYIIDTKTDPKAPSLFKVVDGEEVKKKTNLSAPHTVHCMGKDIIVSMLGDANGGSPGGYLHLDQDFEIVGTWTQPLKDMDIDYSYDFWYQPRKNMMVSTEWAAPNTFLPGFELEDVGKGKYGSKVHFWDLDKKEVKKTFDLGEEGLIPLETRMLHNPDSTHGFVGATLSSNIFHYHKDRSDPEIKKVIDVASIEVDFFPVPLPGLITDILVSMDDRFLYFANWLHGDVRQYDITEPSNPKLTGQAWIGGLLGKAPEINGKKIEGGPQMIQLSLDGKRLYVTTSLFSTWDNQFYPGMKDEGGAMVIVDCDTEKGGMKINDKFLVDFGKEPEGPSRAHETRYPGGDCSSDIWT